jgi:hypothetical protein
MRQGQPTPRRAFDRLSARGVTGSLSEPGLRTPPPGLPDPNIPPPNVAESGDPFAALRIIDLVARLERGRAVPIASVVDRLNSAYLDWLFDERVVVDALLQLQANWMTDYRNTSGIALDDVDGRPTLTLEDSSRVDPWIVRQAIRQAEACRTALAEFSRRDRLATGG